MPNLDPGAWAYGFVIVVVLVLIVAALFPTLTSALENYTLAEPTFGPTMETVLPLVIGASILIGVVVYFLAKIRD